MILEKAKTMKTNFKTDDFDYIILSTRWPSGGDFIYDVLDKRDRGIIYGSISGGFAHHLFHPTRDIVLLSSIAGEVAVVMKQLNHQHLFEGLRHLRVFARGEHYVVYDNTEDQYKIGQITYDDGAYYYEDEASTLLGPNTLFELTFLVQELNNLVS